MVLSGIWVTSPVTACGSSAALVERALRPELLCSSFLEQAAPQTTPAANSETRPVLASRFPAIILFMGINPREYCLKNDRLSNDHLNTVTGTADFNCAVS